MGQLIGAVLGMALFGAMTAWIIRVIFRRLPLSWSYAFGIAVFVWPAAWSYSYNQPEVPFFDSLLIYGFGGLLAFPVLVSTAALGKKEDSDTVHKTTEMPRSIARFFGWIVFSVLTALGATCIFAALKGDGPDASLPFFAGTIMLILAFFLWKVLSKKQAIPPL